MAECRYTITAVREVGHDCFQLTAVIVVLLLIPATAVVGSAGSRSCDRLALFFIAADISGHDPSL
jgi:hypothetical protein